VKVGGMYEVLHSDLAQRDGEFDVESVSVEAR
jgi:hypothetical protein